MLRTYAGSCHCQLVKFEARIDFDKGTSKCNCSYCSWLRFWHVQVHVRREDFRLLSDEANAASLIALLRAPCEDGGECPAGGRPTRGARTQIERTRV
jgi:hypothetical protein